jgi:hypothetical protein
VTRSRLVTVDRGIMQTSDRHEAIWEFQEGSSEQRLEIPIDPRPNCLGSSGRGLMLRGRKTGQSVILPVDDPDTGGYGVSGPPAGRALRCDRSRKTNAVKHPFSRSSAGAVCLMIASPRYSTLGCIPSRSDSPSCRKLGPCPPRSSELR